MPAAEPDPPPAAAGASFRTELSTAGRPALIRWSTPVPPQVYDAYAVLTGAGPVLVDPEVAAPEDGQRLLALVGQRPVATVLTSAWHERAAYRLRDAHGIPVWAPAAGAAELEGRPDHLYGDGAALPGGLRAVGIDGRYAGDTVLRWAPPDGPGVLFTGDVVLGQLHPEDRRADHWRRAPGLYLWLHGPDACGRRCRGANIRLKGRATGQGAPDARSAHPRRPRH